MFLLFYFFVNSLTGIEVEKCFSTFVETNLDASILYDNCITELCYYCNDINDDCQPNITLEMFKNVCKENGVLLN